MATDLAAIRHRTGVLQADRACYFVGAPQTLHLKQLFAVAEAANYLPPDHRFVHYPFGSVLDPDTGKMFKTRDGADVKLADVLAEAVTRAQRLVDKKSSGLSDDERAEVARCVGVGAVKYAELSKNRVTDYSFAWDTMLSFEGDTAPYLQYAYTRIRSVFRRAGVDPDQPSDEIAVSEPAERVLGVKLLQFEEAILAVVDDCQANILCQYLYELAGNFMTFYEACPILNAEDTVRKSRLGLAALTARTLGTGLGLLGIETVEQM
jgi:arginyl-tRNA synthetase